MAVLSKESLTKKVGPLPVWGWATVAVGGYFIWTKFGGIGTGKKDATEEVSPAEPSGIPPGVPGPQGPQGAPGPKFCPPPRHLYVVGKRVYCRRCPPGSVFRGGKCVRNKKKKKKVA